MEEKKKEYTEKTRENQNVDFNGCVSILVCCLVLCLAVFLVINFGELNASDRLGLTVFYGVCLCIIFIFSVIAMKKACWVFPTGAPKTNLEPGNYKILKMIGFGKGEIIAIKDIPKFNPDSMDFVVIDYTGRRIFCRVNNFVSNLKYREDWLVSIDKDFDKQLQNYLIIDGDGKATILSCGNILLNASLI